MNFSSMEIEFYYVNYGAEETLQLVTEKYFSICSTN